MPVCVETWRRALPSGWTWMSKRWRWLSALSGGAARTGGAVQKARLSQARA